MTAVLRIGSLACLLWAVGCSGDGAPGSQPDGAAAPDGGRPTPDAGRVTDAGTDALAAGDAGGGADAAGGGLGHPFGLHGGYAPGVLAPPGHSQADLDRASASFYDGWKTRYLKPGCSAGQYLVKSSPSTSAYTVSEGHGYGMLIAVLMAGHDPDARKIFDGLYAYYDAHRDSHDLMAWRQDAACQNVMRPDSATDGDLDIAYSLLLAHRQWGSGGAIDYRTQAGRVIAAILAFDVHPQSSLLVGDWAGAGDTHYTGTRPSDFATSHFRSFAAATGVTRWNDVAAKAYALVAYLQDHFAAATGLLPDFAVDASGTTPSPAPPSWLEDTTDGEYAWNACRVPWRLATDYLVSGDVRAQAAVRRMNASIRSATGDDPTRIRDGYELGGQSIGSAPELAFVAPFAVSAMVEPASGTNGPWLGKLWDHVAAQGPSDYYGDTLKLLCMLVMSGNWWAP